MMAHGYTISAACDGKNCIGRFLEQHGHNKTEAFYELRRRGWEFNKRTNECWCPDCKKEKH